MVIVVQKVGENNDCSCFLINSCQIHVLKPQIRHKLQSLIRTVQLSKIYIFNQDKLWAQLIGKYQ